MSEEFTDDPPAPDFQTAFWSAKHALSVATSAAFSRHGVHEGQQFILRRLWAEDGLTPGEVARRLGDTFGTSTNKCGYTLLNPCVRIIQGDGMDLEQIGTVLAALADAKFSTDNVAFGMGGGLLQKVDRDTMKWAMKASAIKINGFWQDVYKDPVTDPGKVSKKGRQGLIRDAAGWRTVPLWVFKA